MNEWIQISPKLKVVEFITQTGNVAFITQTSNRLRNASAIGWIDYFCFDESCDGNLKRRNGEESFYPKVSYEKINA